MSWEKIRASEVPGGRGGGHGDRDFEKYEEKIMVFWYKVVLTSPKLLFVSSTTQKKVASSNEALLPI